MVKLNSYLYSTDVIITVVVVPVKKRLTSKNNIICLRGKEGFFLFFIICILFSKRFCIFIDVLYPISGSGIFKPPKTCKMLTSDSVAGLSVLIFVVLNCRKLMDQIQQRKVC